MTQPKLKLYTYPGNKNANKALIAAQYVGVDIEVPSDFQMGVTNKTPEFLKLNPNGKVPTLETPEGGVFESNAIARYVARLADTGLFGTTLLDTAFVESWIDYSTNEVDAPLMSWALPYYGHLPYDKKKEMAAQEALKKSLGTLDAYLQSHTYLVGDNVTLADIITFCNMYYGFTKVFDPEFRKQFPSVERYFVTLARQPKFAAVVGSNVQLCSEVPTAPAPAKKDEKKKDAAKAKEDAKPAPAAAAVAAAPPAETPAKAEKPKNPLDALPPSKMVLDSWKRLYSNTPAAKFQEICVAGLWNGADVPNSPTQEHFEGFDPEGFSLWFCDYKYTDENTVNFVVMNKVGGMLQRVDYVRKYGFAVMCILKNEKGEFPIRGVWMFRGQNIPQIMQDECYDLELYNWTKVDISDEAQKKRVEDMIAEEATIDGLENIECKVFK
jgi:elongation factor 1-gamma